MKELKLLCTTDPFQYADAHLRCRNTKLPAGLRASDEELGKGSHNKVYAAS